MSGVQEAPKARKGRCQCFACSSSLVVAEKTFCGCVSVILFSVVHSIGEKSLSVIPLNAPRHPKSLKPPPLGTFTANVCAIGLDQTSAHSVD